MASATITLVDDKALDVRMKVVFDPPELGPEATLTPAQRAAFDLLDLLRTRVLPAIRGGCNTEQPSLPIGERL